uniref:Uncharacterized protein n=1 Tax=Megaselia scalaris TaxID=36166 RepID=T1H6J4_MEGSC
CSVNAVLALLGLDPPPFPLPSEEPLESFFESVSLPP